ncbi:MAG: PA0069 family radical SAM protein [Phycisphaeraceae bacterium]|nr:PA0069 family radical SAM protein [Phycisphaeraceae bacterium]
MDQRSNEFQDALVKGPAHRRGAGLNPGNRFESVRLHVLGEEIDRQFVEHERTDGTLARMERQVFTDRTKSIINRVARTSDVPFDWTLNPYRGCEHGCVYCYARQYHEYIGLSCGLDFETKLVAKPDAPELLRKELAAAGWRAEPIVMSASTDIYQPIEHEMRIARQCLEVLTECGQPVSGMTKSSMVLRDIDLWSRLAAQGAGRVTITLVTLDAELARSLEPRASAPSARLRAIRELTNAGVPVTVNVAPVIPGLTESEVPAILEAVADAGALSASWIMLRLPYQLKALFLDWLERAVHPDRARKVESLIRQMRDGKLYEARVARGRGRGPFAEQVAQTFKVFQRRFGLDRELPPLSSAAFRRPQSGGQLALY